MHRGNESSYKVHVLLFYITLVAFCNLTLFIYLF